jgi:hypothetical protein
MVLPFRIGYAYNQRIAAREPTTGLPIHRAQTPMPRPTAWLLSIPPSARLSLLRLLCSC